MRPAGLARQQWLTDGWVHLHDALKTAYGDRSLPETERELLKDLYVRIEVALRSR